MNEARERETKMGKTMKTMWVVLRSSPEGEVLLVAEYNSSFGAEAHAERILAEEPGADVWIEHV
jgi:hypothetical protein